MEARPLLETLEGEEEPAAALAYLAAPAVRLDGSEVRAALRRALLLLAAGGDPRRALEPEGRPVRALAGDLDDPARRQELEEALAALRAQARGLPRVEAALDALLADRDAAWRWLACALLAGELAGEA